MDLRHGDEALADLLSALRELPASTLGDAHLRMLNAKNLGPELFHGTSPA